jgi:hypothetical protein
MDTKLLLDVEIKFKGKKDIIQVMEGDEPRYLAEVWSMYFQMN